MLYKANVAVCYDNTKTECNHHVECLNILFYFPNGRYIDCLSLTCATKKIKYYKYTINTISTINNIEGKYESPNSKE